MSIFLFEHQISSSWWPTFPFFTLLLLMATGAAWFPKFWHESYKLVSFALGTLVAIWYLFVFKQTHLVADTFSEYFSFISILIALYVASGGIYIFADFESKTKTNIIFLIAAAVLTNFIGTTGASVLLIRPFMRLNRYRLKPYHIVFFIFIVSNAGGLLTPIGNPPLFVGFLKGVPFFFTLTHLFPFWLIAITFLLLVFYLFERKNTSLDEVDESLHYKNKLFIEGGRNFIWLGFIIATVFIDPNIFPQIPSIEIEGRKLSYIREVIQLLSAWICYKNSNKNAMASNNFSFEPIREVTYLFYGIFLTIMPVMQVLQVLGGKGNHLNLTEYYFSTGITSGFLDNAPSYMSFMTLAFSSSGFFLGHPGNMNLFLESSNGILVTVISVASVLWGGISYIGNGPNLIIKSMAEENGMKMPTFFRYILNFSIPVLLPILILTWLLLLTLN